MEETISLKELFETLKKRLMLIVSITLVAAIISGIVSFFVLTPIYQASTLILVNQSKSEQSIYNPGEVQTNLALINTYSGIIKSPPVLEIVAKDLNLNMTAEQLASKITVSSDNGSQLLNLSVQDPSPKTAAVISNKTAEVFQKKIVSFMSINNVHIISPAKVADNPSPIKPQPLLNIAIAIVVGLMAGVGIAFLLEYLDNTIKNELDIEKELGLPILGVIAPIEDQKLEELSRRREARNTTVRGETHGS
ncbi:YveK family protein [Neobacillus mesonae]|uniref:YveK family protein n=1 Tax=Neobacillus mesonae TaxID=1193713 RepID=UPI002E1A1FC4|nr:Wzz/FepE/Etk N-terminal domain-containing protein [Neobacillus mesonae]MED4207254.1 Wzz/FepE/Etk N-terminal domain-containing protein [Neobacillus mesonae]